MEQKPKDWDLSADHASTAQFAKFHKDHPLEYNSLFTNLDKILGLLSGGQKIGGFHVGFFRSEGGDVYRIGQTGVAHAKESRLYVFPDQENRIMFILSIGDKDDQETDVNEAKSTVKKIRESRPQKQ
jgi:hypothetical protein